MKKKGVINQQLMRELAGLGHGDTFLLCDAGFPIPSDQVRVDVSLSLGVPTMKQCLSAILSEVNIQKVVIASEMKEWNTQGRDFLISVFRKQEFEEIPQSDLVMLAQNAKFIVRSGELGCYSNVLMEAASAVDFFKKDLIIDPDKWKED